MIAKAAQSIQNTKMQPSDQTLTDFKLGDQVFSIPIPNAKQSIVPFVNLHLERCVGCAPTRLAYEEAEMGAAAAEVARQGTIK